MKKGCLIAIIAVVVIGVILYSFFAGTYNKMVQRNENVKEKWSQVENVYQRRYDLIPNLVNTVKGYAEHEQETFKMVTEARAKAGGTLQVSDDVLNDPQKFQKFQQAQAGLASAMQRLMVVVERYPDLKANQNFLALQDQLEGSENRIAVERRKFNEVTQTYNSYIRKFPQLIYAGWLGFEKKDYFKAQQGAETAPEVQF